jgi:hypothetical protein
VCWSAQHSLCAACCQHQQLSKAQQIATWWRCRLPSSAACNHCPAVGRRHNTIASSCVHNTEHCESVTLFWWCCIGSCAGRVFAGLKQTVDTNHGSCSSLLQPVEQIVADPAADCSRPLGSTWIQYAVYVSRLLHHAAQPCYLMLSNSCMPTQVRTVCPLHMCPMAGQYVLTL